MAKHFWFLFLLDLIIALTSSGVPCLNQYLIREEYKPEVYWTSRARFQTCIFNPGQNFKCSKCLWNALPVVEMPAWKMSVSHFPSVNLLLPLILSFSAYSIHSFFAPLCSTVGRASVWAEYVVSNAITISCSQVSTALLDTHEPVHFLQDWGKRATFTLCTHCAKANWIINWVARALNADWLTNPYTTGMTKIYFYCSNYVGNQFIIAIRHLWGLWYIANIPWLSVVSRHSAMRLA